MKINFAYSALVLVFIVIGCSNSESEEYGFRSEDVASGISPFNQRGLTEGPMPAMASPMVPPIANMDRVAKASNKSKSIAPDPVVEGVNRSQNPQIQPGVDQEVAQLVSNERIIVRTVNIGIDVENIAKALNSISEIANDMDGWIVDSNRIENNSGRISIRVPSSSLSSAVESIRSIASKIEFENSTSQDVTEEYVDYVSKMNTLTATEDALLKLLAKSEDVNEALKVQKALGDLQKELEALKGKIKFLEQTSAFSLIDVQLSLNPTLIKVDAGLDQRGWSGEVLRFKSFFYPPEGIDSYTFTWDFGDGTPPVTNYRVSSTKKPGEKVTATVAHQFFDQKDSPFMVEVEISGFGEDGLIEGKDDLIVSISDRPIIEVFAGETIQIESGEEVKLSGSFTSPKDIEELEYFWDFGDGSSGVSGKVQGGNTTAEAIHKYKDYRPYPYTAKLTVKGNSELGEVESEAIVSVFVIESKGWFGGGFDVVDTLKTAVRSLSILANWLLILVFWVAIFSPLWIGSIALVWFLLKRFQRLRS